MNSDFKDLLCCLNEFKVRYLVIGGYAVVIHSEPRYTKDLDIWVDATTKNASALLKALKEFGAPTNSIIEEDISKPGTVFIFGIEPNRVDIINKIKGANFSSAFQRRIKAKVDDLEFNCISLKDLIHIKKIAGRIQDRLDVEKLEHVNKSQQKRTSKNYNRRK